MEIFVFQGEPVKDTSEGSVLILEEGKATVDEQESTFRGVVGCSATHRSLWDRDRDVESGG